MPLKRRHARIPAAIALVALAAFAVLWIGARTEWARGLVAGRISDATGLPASIEDMRIVFVPSPALDIGGLAIAQPPGFDGRPLLEIGRLRLLLPWRSVFGAARLDAVKISDATARLAIGSDGVSNWSKLATGSSAGTAEAANPAWFIGAFDLERGTIEYRGLAAKSDWQLTAITLMARDVAPATEFPFDLRLGGVLGPNTIHYAMKGQARLDFDGGRYEASALDFRGWAGGDPLPLAGVELTGALKQSVYENGTGVATLSAGRFNLAGIPGRFDGTVDVDEPELVAAIRITTEPFAPRASAIIFGHPLPVTADPVAFESLQLALEARLQDGELKLDPVSGRLDDTNFTAQVVPGKRFVRANLDRIDFNRYLPPEDKTVRKNKATLESMVAELAKFDLDAEIRMDEALIAGARIHDAVIRVERDSEHTP